MALLSQLHSMSIVEPAAAAPSITDWAQTIVTIVGIIIAAWVAVRVAAKQHDRQVLHQTKKDVADALGVLEDIKQECFNVKTLAEISEGESVDAQLMSDAMGRLIEGSRRLESASQLLQLTAPRLIFTNARNVRNEASKLKSLMVVTINAHVRVELQRKLGVVEPLGRVTTEVEYNRQLAALDDAEMRLTVATMDYELFASPRQWLRSQFGSLWFRTDRFARRRIVP
jgi:hypothetical protein